MEVINYYDEGAPILAYEGLTAARTAREVDFVIRTLGLSPPATILDVGCGFGRHAIALAQRGFEVTGIDPSEVMLARARELAEETAVSPQFIQASGESFETEQRFDAAICLFNVLGQVSLYGDNRELVKNVAGLLRPNGRFIVEVPDWKTAVANLVIDETVGKGENAPKVNRQFYEESGLILEIFRIWVRGQRRVFLLKYQLLREDELRQLFADAGLRVDGVFASYDEGAFAGAKLIMTGTKHPE